MKLVIILFGLVTIGYALPRNLMDVKGSDHSIRQDVDDDDDAIHGSYSWKSPDGKEFFVIYIADEDGYRVLNSNVLPTNSDGVRPDGNQGSFRADSFESGFETREETFEARDGRFRDDSFRDERDGRSADERDNATHEKNWEEIPLKGVNKRDDSFEERRLISDAATFDAKSVDSNVEKKRFTIWDDSFEERRFVPDTDTSDTKSADSKTGKQLFKFFSDELDDSYELRAVKPDHATSDVKKSKNKARKTSFEHHSDEFFNFRDDSFEARKTTSNVRKDKNKARRISFEDSDEFFNFRDDSFEARKTFKDVASSGVKKEDKATFKKDSNTRARRRSFEFDSDEFYISSDDSFNARSANKDVAAATSHKNEKKDARTFFRYDSDESFNDSNFSGLYRGYDEDFFDDLFDNFFD